MPKSNHKVRDTGQLSIQEQGKNKQSPQYKFQEIVGENDLPLQSMSCVNCAFSVNQKPTHTDVYTHTVTIFVAVVIDNVKDERVIH